MQALSLAPQLCETMISESELISTTVVRERPVLANESLSWDDLAVASSRPYCAPGWALSWWDHLRPEGSTLRSITVNDGSDVIGVLPLCISTDRWGIVTGHLLGHDTSSYSEPLARAGREREVAAALTTSLSSGNEHVDVLCLTGIPHGSPWPRLLQETWPGPRPHLSHVSTMSAPYADLPPGGFDEWFGGRSRQFRQQMRGRKRKFVEQGGRFRRAESTGEIHSRLLDLERLHLSRWSGRGGSQALVPGVVKMLEHAGDQLGPDRLQLWTAEVDGGVVAASLFMSAGQELHYWLGGFDETWAPLSLSILLLIEAVQHAAETGQSRISFGPGEQAYKYRLATGEERLDWIDLLPIQGRYPYVRLVQSPHRAYRLAARRTPPKVKDRARSAVHRLRGQQPRPLRG